MGIITRLITYDVGDDCERCFGNEGRFSSPTPKNLTLLILGVEKYAGAPGYYPPPPNGSFVLTQDLVAPCVWNYVGGAWSWSLDWSAEFTSNLHAYNLFLRPVGFSGNNVGIGTRYFKNEASSPSEWYHGGMAVVA